MANTLGIRLIPSGNFEDTVKSWNFVAPDVAAYQQWHDAFSQVAVRGFFKEMHRAFTTSEMAAAAAGAASGVGGGRSASTGSNKAMARARRHSSSDVSM